MLNSGHHVNAVWTDGQWYGARVLQFNGSHYLVAWDDGAPAGWVPPDHLQLHGDGGTPFVIGQPVKALWSDGGFYGARLTQFNGMQYEVAWDDGSPPRWLSPHQIHAAAPPPPQFAPGQRVHAQWTDGNFFGARIVQQHGNQFEVAWDDGAANTWLSPPQIRADAPGGFAPAPAQQAPAPAQQAPAGPPMGGYAAPAHPHQMGGYADPHAAPVAAGVFAVGQPVFAPFSDGQMYGARVAQWNGAHYLIAWDDGAPGQWFAPSQLRAR
jgi:hypothetical protein